MSEYINELIKKSSYIQQIVIILIVLFFIKIFFVALYVVYETKLGKEIKKVKTDIEEKFENLIDLEVMKSAFTDDEYDEKFPEKEVTSNNAIFTKLFIIEIGKQNRDERYQIVKDYINDTSNKELVDKLINLYYDVSSNINRNLLNYSDNIIFELEKQRREVDIKFEKIHSFLKKEGYPINVIIDTFIIVALIIAFIVYIIYYKIHSLLLIITLTICIIMLVFYRSNTLFLILGFSSFYAAFIFKLYQIYNSNKQQ